MSLRLAARALAAAMLASSGCVSMNHNTAPPPWKEACRRVPAREIPGRVAMGAAGGAIIGPLGIMAWSERVRAEARCKDGDMGACTRASELSEAETAFILTNPVIITVLGLTVPMAAIAYGGYGALAGVLGSLEECE